MEGMNPSAMNGVAANAPASGARSAAPAAAPGVAAPSTPFAASFARAMTRADPAESSAGASSAGPTVRVNLQNGLAATLGNRAPAYLPLAGTATAPGGAHLHETALALRAYRQQLLASNIANADTPNYKAVDIDVAQALRDGITDPKQVPLRYHVASQPSIDGNTVEMDVERAKFAENALMYEYEVDRVKGHGDMLMELLKNLPY